MSSSSEENSSDSATISDPDYVPPRRVSLDSPPSERVNTRSRLHRRSKSFDKLFFSIEPKDSTPILKPTMATVLSFESALQLVPNFDGEDPQRVYPFIDACDFVMGSVDEKTRPILLRAIQQKMTGKAYTVRQYREITSWEMLKGLLEDTFCTKRTPGHLQLELTTCRMQIGESVQNYTTRVEKLLHEFYNVSAKGRSASDTKVIHNFIRETTLMTYVEGLSSNIRNIIKAKNPSTLEEAIKESIEEEKMFLSNKETQRLLQSKPNNSTKYCKNCHRNNHNTNECRYSSRRIDKGQSNKYSKEKNDQRNENNNQTKHCAYCKKSGHNEEECYKKKNAETRKGNQNLQNQPSTSGNGSRPSAQGPRSVKDIKAMGPIKNLCIK